MMYVRVENVSIFVYKYTFRSAAPFLFLHCIPDSSDWICFSFRFFWGEDKWGGYQLLYGVQA